MNGRWHDSVAVVDSMSRIPSQELQTFRPLPPIGEFHVLVLTVINVNLVPSPSNVAGEWQVLRTPISVCRHCDGDAYLLSVAVLLSPPPKEGSHSFATPMLM